MNDEFTCHKMETKDIVAIFSCYDSPSQKMQSHEQRKQVVARGLLHLLHARLDTGRPLEMPFPVEDCIDMPVPIRGVILGADIVK